MTGLVAIVADMYGGVCLDGVVVDVVARWRCVGLLDAEQPLNDAVLAVAAAA